MQAHVAYLVDALAHGRLVYLWDYGYVNASCGWEMLAYIIPLDASGNRAVRCCLREVFPHLMYGDVLKIMMQYNFGRYCIVGWNVIVCQTSSSSVQKAGSTKLM